MDSDFERLDKNKSYCYKCFNLDIILELKLSNDKYLAPGCGHYGKAYHRLAYFNKYKSWLPVCSLNVNAKSKKEILEQMKKQGNCSICGIFNNVRDQNGRGKDLCNCSKDWYNKHNSSETMVNQAIKAGKEFGVKNLINYNKSDKHKITASKIGSKTWRENFKFEIKFCKICNKITKHRSNICFECFPSVKGIGVNIKYCDICKCETPHNGYTCSKCYPDSLKIGFKYFTNLNKCKKHPNEKLRYLNNDIRYTCWSCYKEEFLQIKICKIQNEIENSFVQSTFRDQDSIDWTGAKFAFEKSLVEKEIGWFAYIKFYIDSGGEIKPLVVGKSGSLLVNISGSDVSFSTDPNDGPARKFLKEENLEWCKTQILVIPFETEIEVLNIEKELKNNYSLFYS